MIFRRKKKGNSTRALMGLEGFTNYGIKTTGGELVVFLVQPTNISVLSRANVEVKIRHLLMVLSAHPGLEISCLDSCERFDDNKRFIKRRMQEEESSTDIHTGDCLGRFRLLDGASLHRLQGETGEFPGAG